MRHYLLIGFSSIAGVLLILTSLANVIGFQTTQSSTPAESPLFAVQTTQAIEGTRPMITTEYTGKGTPGSYLFPNNNTRGDLLEKAFAMLTKMTPQQIKKLRQQMILMLSQNPSASHAAASALASFNSQQQEPQNAPGVNRMNGTGLRNDPPTFYCPTLFGYWVPSCMIEGLILVLLFLLSASVYAFCTFFLCYWIYHSVFLCQFIP
jgi:hypothetical protein